MKKSQKLMAVLTIISLLMLSINFGTKAEAKKMNKEELKKEKIAKKVNKSFKSTLAMYPTPNIEDLLDEKMGDRLILHTSANIEHTNNSKEYLKSEGMVLYINTHTKKGYGYYYIEYFWEKESRAKYKADDYPVYYDKGIHLRTSTGDAEFDKKIENFQFLIQYADFKDLNKNKVVDAGYNPNVPSFSLEYKLSNDDELVNKLRQECGFTDKKEPTIELNGEGSYGEAPQHQLDYRQIVINFSKKPSEYLRDSISYDNQWQEEDAFWQEEERLNGLSTNIHR